MTNAAQIVGYAYDSDTYCAPCLRDNGIDPTLLPPIFGGSEFAYQPYCRACADALSATVLRDTESD